jgi:sugar lactone lactonase YvrE
MKAQMKNKVIFIVLSFMVSKLFWTGAALADKGAWRYIMQLPAADAEMKISRPFFSAADMERMRYYVVDPENGRLVSFDRDGKFIAVFDAGGRLKLPVAMARDTNGNIWVVERSVNQLVYIDFNAKQVRNFTLTQADERPIFADRPAVDRKGRLFILDRLRGVILQFDGDLRAVKTFSGDAPTFTGFIDFKIKSDGIWALDALDRKVYHFNDEGIPTEIIKLKSEFEFPFALEIDDAGLLYILDRHAGRISVCDRSGEIKYGFLAKGKHLGHVWYPSYLMFDWEGRLCVVDEGNARVEVFSR